MGMNCVSNRLWDCEWGCVSKKRHSVDLNFRMGKYGANYGANKEVLLHSISNCASLIIARMQK